MDLLKFITAGSVDDGKSTLIGRLLYDSHSILIDQLAQLEKQSRNKENGEINLAILTDGLRAEREQGITIDVAYKYFSTDKRKFIIADAPGHIQYTRNMVTGASGMDLAIILIDARHGIIEQTKRHSLIVSLLGIKHVIVAINKMDLVNHSQQRYQKIIADYQAIQNQLTNIHPIFIPISALNGDNIVVKSNAMHWYEGNALLSILETISIKHDTNETDVRFPVQFVIRPQTEVLHDYRGYAGRLNSGILKKGDAVSLLPSQLSSTITKIEKNGKEINEAYPNQSIIVHLADNIDVSRGDMIVKQNALPTLTQEIEAMVCWMNTKPLSIGAKYILQHNTTQVRCVIKEISYKLNVHSLEKEYGIDNLQLNDIGHLVIKTSTPLAIDTYETNKINGSFILIDETSFVTVGACMIS